MKILRTLDLTLYAPLLVTLVPIFPATLTNLTLHLQPCRNFDFFPLILNNLPTLTNLALYLDSTGFSQSNQWET